MSRGRQTFEIHSGHGTHRVCPDCKRVISDSAQSCLGCGLPLAAVRGSPSPHGRRASLLPGRAVTVTGARAMLGGTTLRRWRTSPARQGVRGEFRRPPPPFSAPFLCSPGSPWWSTHQAGQDSGGRCFWPEPHAWPSAWFLINTQYWVRIGTAGAEANAIASNDAAWTRKVVAAMVEALVGRG